ncbi:MAG: hypothetical protein SF187_30160 [Deltaproteobacteria bacterium]|nr:hypothetical protein [Deltaproteobacteria bacterium]
MRHLVSKGLILGLVALASAPAFAAKSVTKLSFRGSSAFASISGYNGCGTASFNVNASENVSRQTGSGTSESRAVMVSVNFANCDGSSYVGFFQLDGAGYTHSAQGVTINKTIIVDKTTFGFDEWGNPTWVPTGEQATVSISVNLVPTGDYFKGDTNNTQSSTNVFIKNRSRGTIYEVDATLAASIDGVPVSFGFGFPYGQMSDTQFGQLTIITQ